MAEEDNNNCRAWNKHAKRYHDKSELTFDVIDFGDTRCETDEKFQLLPDVQGKSVLELDCGGGNIGITLAKRGASVTGIDISKTQLQIAKQQASDQHVTVRFIESSVESLDFAQFQPVDLVISICALQYVSNLADLFASVYTTLKPGGIFIFSTNDPVFYSIAAKYLWQFDRKQHAYSYQGPEVWKWEDDDDFSFTTYRHPIDSCVNWLVQAGFKIERFHQLNIHHAEAKSEEELFEQLYPRIMVFKCLKT